MRFAVMRISLFLLVFLFVGALAAKEKMEENATQRKELEKIRQEIARYERDLAQKKAKAETINNLIASLDREIDFTANYLRRLRRQIRRSQRQIEEYKKNIEQISEELEKLKALSKRRLVLFYKKRRLKDIELLLSSRSLSQVKVWLRYQKMVAENDRRTFHALVEKRDTLQRQQDLLRLEISSLQQDVEERRKEEKRLQESRRRRKALLASIQEDTRILRQRLEEVKEAQRQILAFITKNEERRLTRDIRQPKAEEKKFKPLPRKTRFADLKGKLTWPTKGEIVGHFGRYRHPKLNTITENLGIEIKAPLGTPVVAVDQGQVQTITWQRGQGNIIIISHDDGYYTVYTHLAEIRVELYEYVERGQVIGTVGDSGSLSGPILHFQIWKNTQNLDPEEWLT